MSKSAKRFSGAALLMAGLGLLVLANISAAQLPAQALPLSQDMVTKQELEIWQWRSFGALVLAVWLPLAAAVWKIAQWKSGVDRWKTEVDEQRKQDHQSHEEQRAEDLERFRSIERTTNAIAGSLLTSGVLSEERVERLAAEILRGKDL